MRTPYFLWNEPNVKSRRVRPHPRRVARRSGDVILNIDAAAEEGQLVLDPADGVPFVVGDGPEYNSGIVRSRNPGAPVTPAFTTPREMPPPANSQVAASTLISAGLSKRIEEADPIEASEVATETMHYEEPIAARSWAPGSSFEAEENETIPYIQLDDTTAMPPEREPDPSPPADSHGLTSAVRALLPSLAALLPDISAAFHGGPSHAEDATDTSADSPSMSMPVFLLIQQEPVEDVDQPELPHNVPEAPQRISQAPQRIPQAPQSTPPAQYVPPPRRVESTSSASEIWVSEEASERVVPERHSRRRNAFLLPPPLAPPHPPTPFVMSPRECNSPSSPPQLASPATTAATPPTIPEIRRATLEDSVTVPHIVVHPSPPPTSSPLQPISEEPPAPMPGMAELGMIVRTLIERRSRDVGIATMSTDDDSHAVTSGDLTPVITRSVAGEHTMIMEVVPNGTLAATMLEYFDRLRQQDTLFSMGTELWTNFFRFLEASWPETYRDLVLLGMTYFSRACARPNDTEFQVLPGDLPTTPGCRVCFNTKVSTFADIQASTQEECPICLERFEDTAVVRQLQCNHLFHVLCIDRWLRDPGSRCPSCRHEVRSSTTPVNPPVNN